MATKSIITRIKNKVDSIDMWQGTTGLLNGEIAIVRVPTGETYINPVTGKSEPVVELLMKVGAEDSNKQPISFDNLPWLSAKASDVYNWAKTQDPSGITVSYVKDTDKNIISSSTLADVLKDLETAETAIEGLKSDVSGVCGLLSVEPASAAANGVVQGITYNAATGKFSVSYGLVQAADINDSAITTAKIADNNVTTAKIATGAVTNDKLGSDISTDKINVGNGDVSGTLSAKIKSMDSIIDGKAEAEHGTHVTYGGNGSATTVSRSDHNHDSVYIKPADVDTKINTALGSVLKYKGTKATTAQLPTSGNATGDVWNISSACVASGTLPKVNAGDNVAWNGTSWDVLAGTVDLSSYYTEDEVNALLESKSDTGHTHTISADAEDDDVVVLKGTSGTDRVSYKATHATSGVTIGTYKSVTVDAKGHVTAGSNPTTIVGFGITDAYTKAEINAELTKYVTVADDQMYLGSDVIIFDCGGAPV